MRVCGLSICIMAVLALSTNNAKGQNLSENLFSNLTVSIESHNYPNNFLRHQNFGAFLQNYGSNESIRDFNDDTSFHIRPGLAGEGVSFESKNFPGYYLRHAGLLIFLHRDDGSRQFASDSSFHIRNGLAGSGFSFESVNRPGYFVRHFAKRFRISAQSNSQTFRDDATFHFNN